MSDEYDDVGFVAHHTRFRHTPSLDQHRTLFQSLLRLPGVVPYRQKMQVGRDEQHGLGALVQDQARRREILAEIRAIATDHKVGIDLVQRRTSEYVDRVLKGELPGQYSDDLAVQKACVGCSDIGYLDDDGLCAKCIARVTYHVVDHETATDRFHVVNQLYGVRVFASNNKGEADSAARDWTAGRRAKARQGIFMNAGEAIDAVAHGQPVRGAAKTLTKKTFVRNDVVEFTDGAGILQRGVVLRAHRTVHGLGYVVQVTRTQHNVWVVAADLRKANPEHWQ